MTHTLALNTHTQQLVEFNRVMALIQLRFWPFFTLRNTCCLVEVCSAVPTWCVCLSVCVCTSRQFKQVIPPNIQVSQSFQLTHLRRQRLDLITADILQTHKHQHLVDDDHSSHGLIGHPHQLSQVSQLSQFFWQRNQFVVAGN